MLDLYTSHHVRKRERRLVWIWLCSSSFSSLTKNRIGKSKARHNSQRFAVKDEAGDQVGNHSIARRSSRNRSQNTYLIACSHKSIFSKNKNKKTKRGDRIVWGGVKLKILTIGIRQHQGQDEKYCKSPPGQLETALVESQERHADREDEHDCIPVSRHLGVSAHDLEVGIVVLDVTTGETGDCDLPGTAAVVAQLLWWIRLLVVHSITLPADFLLLLFFAFSSTAKEKGHTAKAIVAEILVKPQKKRKIYDGAHCDDNTRSEARIFVFPPTRGVCFSRETLT